jgi:hypothetical protein
MRSKTLREPGFHPPAPDGTDADWSYVSAGAVMAGSDARQKERALKSEPNDFACHLMLLRYYGRRTAGQEKYFAHMLWMIDHRPADYVTFYLGRESHSRAFVWTKARERKAGDRWKQQVKSRHTDAQVLCNAAAFFGKFDQPTSEKLLKRAKAVNLTLALPARKLAYQYRFLASKALPGKQANLVRRALVEADESLRRRDLRGERIGVLQTFTPTAIKFGHLEQARKYALRLKYYGEGFYLWSQYAYLFLAWLDLRENRIRGFRFKLKRLRKLFKSNPSHVASCNAALCLVSDALRMGEILIAQDVLRVLILGSREPEKAEEQAELEEWLAAIKQKRSPNLRILNEKMAKLF